MALGINGNASSRILNVLPKATCELHRMLNERCSTQCVSARKTEDTVVAQKNEQILRKGAIKALNSLSALVLVMEQCCLKVHMCDCPCCASIFIVCVCGKMQHGFSAMSVKTKHLLYVIPNTTIIAIA